MTSKRLPLSVLSAVIEPNTELRKLSGSNMSAISVLLSCSIWLLLLPPTILYIGASNFGWMPGGQEPLFLSDDALALTTACYFFALVFGFFSTAFVSRWMASTYDADTSWALHFLLVTIVGTPLSIASLMQWYPHIFLNLLILIPAVIWSMTLLYKSVPALLGITPEKGMLMASSLVGWLLVAAVSLLGLTIGLWTLGVGPFLGV